MDYFKKRFSFLSNKLGKRRTRFSYILENKKMEIIYHLFPSFFYFLSTILIDLKIYVYQD